MGRRERRTRRRLRGSVRLPVTKTDPTRPRGLRGRPGWLGYWLRRPEPSLVLAALFTVLFVGMAVADRDWVPLIGAALVVGAGVFVWFMRDVATYNADRWRQGYEDVY